VYVVLIHILSSCRVRVILNTRCTHNDCTIKEAKIVFYGSIKHTIKLLHEAKKLLKKNRFIIRESR